jgi:hypothetical protein
MDKRTDAQKKKDFLKKHPPLEKGKELVKDRNTGMVSSQPIRRAKTVEEAFLEQEKLGQRYDIGMAKVEDNLIDFLKKEDPLVYDEKVLAMVRRPSNREIRNMVPKELMEYADRPDDVPDDMMKDYEDRIYEIMADLITKPKWTKEKWAEINNPWFQRLFWDHVSKVINMTQAEIGSF